jgi:hypothetical protein
MKRCKGTVDSKIEKKEIIEKSRSRMEGWRQPSLRPRVASGRDSCGDMVRLVLIVKVRGGMEKCFGMRDHDGKFPPSSEAWTSNGTSRGRGMSDASCHPSAWKGEQRG